ncbi:unnamed protein product [Soboliphyme baturini]|uniref:Lzipper-MIP1 domain-containing protein n=1 Tax=Soboliphyme baturini TaxID=241478 RepID=A0A183IZG4_9BILA|nr:unnamed protein product [Soboliphyme baturini]
MESIDQHITRIHGRKRSYGRNDRGPRRCTFFDRSLEKEERWQVKLQEWSSRLQVLMDNEQKLFSEIRYLQRERNDLKDKVNALAADKQGLQKKCRELEKELFELREQLDSKTKQWSICHRCSNIFMPNVPPECEKKYAFSPNGLRNELEALRMEVSQLRQSLHLQTN